MTEHDLEFMSAAIEQAESCQSHKEDDPKVGAVLVRDSKLIASARRGEEAPGDHAEFTLLHKKVRSKDLCSGSTLYTTLEPCTTRKHDKLPCANWIIRKEIQRVVIGILDPNPNICGRGYWRLLDAGVQVDFFPSHLASRIMEANRTFIQSHRINAKDLDLFAQTLAARRGTLVAPYPGLGYGDCLSLQDCPELREGWPMSQIAIELRENEPFTLPAKYKPVFDDYYSACYDEKGFNQDGEKFMAWKNPAAFTDAPLLSLVVVPTSYSRVMFYQDRIAKMPTDRDPLISEVVEGSMMASFAHSLCMHMVVVTRDNMVLLTQRSPKVEHFPGSWSVSVEEQLSRKDFSGDEASIVLRWGQRLLREELGLEREAYHNENLRIFSVFLEAYALNISVYARVELNIDSGTLDNILKSHPRKDYEFTHWRFLELDKLQLLSELFRPRQMYHPSSSYRLLMTYLHAFGVPKPEDIKPFLNS